VQRQEQERQALSKLDKFKADQGLRVVALQVGQRWWGGFCVYVLSTQQHVQWWDHRLVQNSRKRPWHRSWRL
jgi:hypothetical protein